jgi:CheY-like chemotaxis protein
MSQPGKRVLCAERNADICHLIFSLLSHAGYEVVKAGSARECLNAALAGGFDLYVLGDTYADDDGLELCRRLRELTPSTPILFLSPHATGAMRAAPKGWARPATSSTPKTSSPSSRPSTLCSRPARRTNLDGRAPRG